MVKYSYRYSERPHGLLRAARRRKNAALWFIMNSKIIAAAVAAALALACVPALSACSSEPAVKYTLYSAADEKIRTDSFAPDASAPTGEEAPEAAPEGAYYVVTGYSGRPADVVIPAQLNGAPVYGVASEAFGNCRYMQTLEIEEGVSYAGQAAFVFCTLLSEVTIPSSMNVADSMFAGCLSLESVNLAEGITSIGNRAFEGCTSLKDINADEDFAVNFPSTLTYIGGHAFYDCNVLSGDIVIPDKVTSISLYSFSRCYKITSVSMGPDVTEIGFGAFGGCFGLESITLSPSLEKIGEYAFSNTYAMQSITLPGSVSYVGMNAFMSSGVASVIVPQGKAAWLYTRDIASDDSETPENEAALPGSDEAESWLFYFSFDGSRDYKGYLPSFELSSPDKAADYFKNSCLEAYWYFVTPQG